MKRLTGLALLWALNPVWSSAQETAELDRAFSVFWNAPSREAAEKASAAILAVGPSFQTVWDRLSDGRDYRAEAEQGELRWATLNGSGSGHLTTIVTPPNYNPRIKYPVRVYLHGGVARPDRGGEPGARRSPPFHDRYFAVYPSGYEDAQWWFGNQLANLDEILDRLKRSYNIDENRAHLMGVSDGGTGTFFAAMKNPTPWSCFFPLNGFLRVLANPQTRADGELFPANSSNRPLYAVNGVRDPLYPAIAARPYLVMLYRAGGEVLFRPMADAGHDTSWWPSESGAMDRFEEEHPRHPYPDSLSWETERTDRYNRVNWLVITELGPGTADVTFPESNTIEIEEPPDFGIRVDPRKGNGRQITEVVPHSTAAGIGLQKGDTVIRLDESMVRTARDMARAMDEHQAGTPLIVEVDRKGRRHIVQGVYPPPPKPARQEEVFRHSGTSGRVDVSREGNTFRALARGVRAFTLLLSPAVVDFQKPVTVTVNGRMVFEGPVEASVATLLRYAARDNDRTMLFGAELPVRVP